MRACNGRDRLIILHHARAAFDRCGMALLFVAQPTRPALVCGLAFQVTQPVAICGLLLVVGEFGNNEAFAPRHLHYSGAVLNQNTVGVIDVMLPQGYVVNSF